MKWKEAVWNKRKMIEKQEGIQVECVPPDFTSGGPQVNNFEQVSSVGHQVSVVGGPRSDV